MAKWYSGKTCRLSVMLSMTFGYFLVEIVFGYLTKSMALVADSFHMLSDVLALIVAFFCMKISRRRQSKKNTFGWVRAEVLGALVNAVFLLALCFSIFIEAVKRLIEGEPIKDPKLILIVGAVGLVVNVIGIFMFHGHASVHGHSHARPVPLNLETDEDVGEHYRMVASEAHSISVLHPLPEDLPDDSSTFQRTEGVNNHSQPLNSSTLKQSSKKTVKESALILLQTVPTHINVRQIKEKLLKNIDGVLAIHDFHVWRLAGNRIIATAHIRCRNLTDYMKVAEKIKEFFHNEGIHSTTIQPEFTEMENSEVNEDGEVVDDCVLVCPSMGECVADTCCEPNGSAVSVTLQGTQSTATMSSSAPSRPSCADEMISVPKAPSANKSGGSSKVPGNKDSSIPLLNETAMESENRP